MINETLTKLESSFLATAPGYLLAPVMLIGASAISMAFVYLRYRQTFSLRDMVDRTFPIKGWRSKSTMIDVILYVAGKISFALPMAALVLFLVTLSQDIATNLVPGHLRADPGIGVIILFCLGLIIMQDLGDYLAHYMLHKVPFLWELHKVHHSATFLSPITSFRVHPLEPHLYSICHTFTLAPVAGLFVFYWNVTQVELFALLAVSYTITLALTFNHLKHSHFQISLGILDYVFISPHMHQLHHSARVEHWDRNMGVIFSVWDWIFRTGVREDTRVPVEYGIGRGEEADAQYLTLYGVFVMPVIDMVKVATGRTQPLPLPDEGIGHTTEKQVLTTDQPLPANRVMEH